MTLRKYLAQNTMNQSITYDLRNLKIIAIVEENAFF